MKKQIVVFRHGRPSTKNIFNALKIDNLELIYKSVRHEGFVVRSKGEAKRVEFGELDCSNNIVIRWGNRIPILKNDSTIIYNQSKYIKIVNDKGLCRRFLSDNGIAVPKTWLLGDQELEDMKNLNTVPYPLIGRPEHHGRGSDFHIINSNEELERAINKGCTYFSLIYPKTREFGVHIGHGKLLACMEKPKPQDDKVAWNRALNDEPFSVVPFGEYQDYICRLALDAAKVCKLDFCRVDIMSDPTDNNLPQAVVCELNTAPTLNSSPYVTERWTKYFNWLFKSNVKRKHWDYSVFKKVKSLAWKNYQFDE